MPVGIPKVAFRLPGEEKATWVDVYNVIYRSRSLFLFHEINSETSNQIVGLMTYLAIEDSTKGQHLFINSPGGCIISGTAIYDTMQTVSPVIHTIGAGEVVSMASLILSGGEFTKRTAFPHARVMIHQPLSDFYDTLAEEFIDDTDELLIIRDNITKLYQERTGQNVLVIAYDLERDVFMSAAEARDYGIVDFIAGQSEVYGFTTHLGFKV